MAKLVLHHDQPCRYCTRIMDIYSPDDLAPTRDHYPIPKSRGGARTVICCTACNRVKEDMSADEWAFYMSEHPQWWLRPPPRRTLRRGARLIRQAETPSTPMKEPLSQIKFTGMLASEFGRVFGASRRDKKGDAK